MKFRFIGDPRDNGSGPDTMPMHGLTFNRKDWTEVADPESIRQLKTHSHFESSETASASEARRHTAQADAARANDQARQTAADSRSREDAARDEANRLATERAAKSKP